MDIQYRFDPNALVDTTLQRIRQTGIWMPLCGNVRPIMLDVMEYSYAPAWDVQSHYYCCNAVFRVETGSRVHFVIREFLRPDVAAIVPATPPPGEQWRILSGLLLTQSQLNYLAQEIDGCPEIQWIHRYENDLCNGPPQTTCGSAYCLELQVNDVNGFWARSF